MRRMPFTLPFGCLTNGLGLKKNPSVHTTWRDFLCVPLTAGRSGRPLALRPYLSISLPFPSKTVLKPLSLLDKQILGILHRFSLRIEFSIVLNGQRGCPCLIRAEDPLVLHHWLSHSFAFSKVPNCQRIFKR